MKISDVTLTLFAWDDIPATSYGAHTGKFSGQTRLGLLAIATDQGQRFVLVVQPDQQVAYRAVQLGALHGDQRVIASGLQPGEQVIVSSLMKVRPGMKVQPQPAAAAQAQAATSPKS